MMGVRKLWVPESSDIDIEGVHHSYPEIREWLKTWINHESSDLGFFFFGRTHGHTYQLQIFEHKHKITSLLFLFSGFVIFGF